MTLTEARTLLDTARAGGLVPAHRITEALGLTGDLGPHRVYLGEVSDFPRLMCNGELEVQRRRMHA